jgi:hypothetical protein
VLVGGSGSVGVGGGGAVSGFVSAGGAGVGAGCGGAVGLGADGRVFLRFTVFLLTSSLSSSWATFSPTYRLPRIADKALIFDGNTALRKLRSCLAWDALALHSGLSVFLRELNLDRGNVSLLTLISQNFGSDLDFLDVECAGEESSATYLYHINSLRYNTASSLHSEFLTATIEMHHDCCYVGHYELLSDENCVEWNAATDRRFSFTDPLDNSVSLA